MKAVCLIAKIGQIIPVIDFYPQQIKDRETKSSLDFVTCRVAEMGQVESDHVFPFLPDLLGFSMSSSAGMSAWLAIPARPRYNAQRFP